QCTHGARGACGSGASGSWTTSAKLFVPAGGADHARGGETSPPSHVNRAAIDSPAANAGEVSWNDDSAAAVPPSIATTTPAAIASRAPRMWNMSPSYRAAGRRTRSDHRYAPAPPPARERALDLPHVVVGELQSGRARVLARVLRVRGLRDREHV